MLPWPLTQETEEILVGFSQCKSERTRKLFNDFLIENKKMSHDHEFLALFNLPSKGAWSLNIKVPFNSSGDAIIYVQKESACLGSNPRSTIRKSIVLWTQH